MKRFLLTALACGAIMSASAQGRIFNNPDNEGYFGLRFSIDGAIPGDDTISENGIEYSKSIFGGGPGFSIGAVYNLPIVANLYFEPGLSFYYNAVSIKKGALEDVYDIMEDYGGKLTNRSVRNSGMKIPLVLGYHFDFFKNFNLAVFTGPVLDIGFSSDMYIKFKYGEDKFRIARSMYRSETFENHGNLNRFNADWRIGVGINYKNFFASLSGDIRMTNMYHVAEQYKNLYKETYRQNLFQLTLGYNFK